MPSATFTNLPPDKRQRILDAAIKEFGARCLLEANLANIVKDAKISRGSLYQYFPSKSDLYVYVFDSLRSDRAEYVRPAFIYYKKDSFMRFFEEFYLRDSEFLLMHPPHIELGKMLYSGTDSVSRGLIHRLQTRYREWFFSAIEYDIDHGIIDTIVDASILTDLCVHFVTDIFIFQSIHEQLSLRNIREHLKMTLYILQNGINAK
jgi:AcrR family transcriptional regulator